MGKTIGRFEVRRELGRGAQSVVYLAWDPQLQREVSIKALNFTQADKEQNAQLLKEARIVSRLRHPHIVPIFDVGEQDGQPYLVFEYIEGESLAEAIRAGGAVPPAKAAELMVQVLGALEEAHRQGIVHRDLKPSNILIDVSGAALVMDFGIAAQVSVGGAGEEGLSGTPGYMAPEYILHHAASEKVDIFAAGLVFLEMLTGHRYFEGSEPAKVIYRVASEPVQIPPDAGIAEALGSIILKACEMDSERRLSSASAMRDAIEDYLGVGKKAEEVVLDSEGKRQSTFDFLMRRMRLKSDFPALSESVSAINRLSDAETESVHKLSDTVLRDFALTNKILKLVNSAYYRQAGGGNISTVSRAMIVLGFNAIRNIAVTILMFEHMQNKTNARDLKEAFLRVNMAGLLAREACMKISPREAEEAFICGMFHALGQILALYYFPEESEEIRKLMQQQTLSESEASLQVLGITFEELGIGIAQSWGFPSLIVNSMRNLPAGRVRKPATRDETLRALASYANELLAAGDVSAQGGDRDAAIRSLADRYSASLKSTESQLRGSLKKSYEELESLAGVFQINLKQSNFARQFSSLVKTTGIVRTEESELEETLINTMAGATAVMGVAAESPPAAAGPEPAQSKAAQTILAAGIQDIMNSLVDDFALNDVLRIILETIYRAMKFKRVLLCLRDPNTGLMTARMGFGPDSSAVIPEFRFPVPGDLDVFQLAVSKGLDIIIADIDDPRISKRIPAWYRRHVPAKTFVLLPLKIKNNPVALIYCDNERAGSIVVPENELTLLKALRNQALLAIKQSM